MHQGGMEPYKDNDNCFLLFEGDWKTGPWTQFSKTYALCSVIAAVRECIVLLHEQRQPMLEDLASKRLPRRVTGERSCKKQETET